MQLSSFQYIFIFLPVSITGFFLLQRTGYRNARAWLLLCSLVFYATQGPAYIPLLLGSVFLNFAISHALRTAKEGKSLLLAGIAGNVLILCVFKYAYFLVANLNLIFQTKLELPVVA